MRPSSYPLIAPVPADDLAFARTARTLLEYDSPSAFEARLRTAYPRASVEPVERDGQLIWYVLRDGLETLIGATT